MFICACSDVGRTRKVNQDAFFYSEEKEVPIYIIADGMGGHKAGGLASNLAIHVISKMYNEFGDDLASGRMEIAEFINKSLKAANEKILEESKKDEEIGTMGTTVTMMMEKDYEMYIGHVGDSRAYMLKSREMVKLTKDHSLVEELLRSGSITEEEARNHPQKNIITRAIGTNQDVVPDIYTREVEKGDVILMCTDGLTNMLRDADIKDRLLNAEKLEGICAKLIDEANELGGPDNITVLVTKIS